MKEGWEYKKLGEIAEIKGGKRLPKGVKLLTTPTKHPYIRVADFNDRGTIETNDIHYISDSVYEQIKRYIIKKEDVYISIAGTIGKSGVIPVFLDGANLTENACRLILSNNLYQRFVYYYTISPSFIKQIVERTKKSAQPKLALTRLSDVIISYPPLSEQQSIVDYLDSAFAKIDAMKANAGKALNEAKALFQASLKEMLEPKEGWEEKTLKELCKVINGRAYSKDEMLKKGKYRLLRVGNFFTNDSWYYSDLELEDDKYCDNGDFGNHHPTRFVHPLPCNFADVSALRTLHNNSAAGEKVNSFLSFPKCARKKCDFGKYQAILWRYVPKCGKKLCNFGKYLLFISSLYKQIFHCQLIYNAVGIGITHHTVRGYHCWPHRFAGFR